MREETKRVDTDDEPFITRALELGLVYLGRRRNRKVKPKQKGGGDLWYVELECPICGDNLVVLSSNLRQRGLTGNPVQCDVCVPDRRPGRYKRSFFRRHQEVWDDELYVYLLKVTLIDGTHVLKLGIGGDQRLNQHRSHGAEVLRTWPTTKARAFYVEQRALADVGRRRVPKALWPLQGGRTETTTLANLSSIQEAVDARLGDSDCDVSAWMRQGAREEHSS